MKIIRTGIAGTLESSDIMITVEPGDGGIEIDLQSQVEKQFGKIIRAVITETLGELDVREARIKAVDKGALDCAIKARVKTAVNRACDPEEAVYDWRTA
jgi:citrate lyase subunit gamma (acyl carrier protein)